MSLINSGSVDDIRCILKLNEKKYTIEKLLQEIKAEQERQNRKSVIDILQTAINRKNKKSC